MTHRINRKIKLFTKAFLLIGFLAICSLNGYSQTRYETDFQLWNDTQFFIPLNKKQDWNAIVWVFGRAGNNVQRVTDARIGGLITKKINKYATVGGGYLYRYSNTTFVQKRYESRFLGLATFTVPLTSDKKWTLVNRNIYQYEDRHSRPNSTVLRSRFWLKREIKIANKKFEPFIAFEPMYDTSLKHFARYRTQIGVSHNFNKKFGGDFYYVRQDETGNRTRPGTLNALGTSFRVHF